MNTADKRITELVRTSRPLFPSDSVSRAVALVRASGGSAAPVVSGMQVVGILRESDLLPVLAASANGSGTDPDSLPPVAQYMVPPSLFLRTDATIGAAAQAFANSDAEVLPVITEHGAYAGYLIRSDITAALSNAIRPAMSAGWDPVGVHLTCGPHGGVSDSALGFWESMFGVLILLGFASRRHRLDRADLPSQPLYAALLSEPT